MDNNLIISKNRICLALDVNDSGRAISLANLLKRHVGLIKIGSELFTAGGSNVVEKIIDLGVPVFLDLKFHDIPNTVAKVSRVVTRLGVSMFNIHAAGGSDMISAAVESAQDEATLLGLSPPLIIAVTVLTSVDEQILQKDLLINSPVEKYVQHLALLAQKNGASGVVASPNEINVIRNACGGEFQIITPGVRPTGHAAGDQKRFTTPSEAIKLGSDFVVIGRPILAAEDPVGSVMTIAKEIANIDQ